MNSQTLLDISRLYFDPKALEFERGREIFDKYSPHTELIEVNSHWKIEELNQNPDLVRDWNQVKAHFSFLASKQVLPHDPIVVQLTGLPPHTHQGVRWLVLTVM
jgi:hypothetical protein